MLEKNLFYLGSVSGNLSVDSFRIFLKESYIED